MVRYAWRFVAKEFELRSGVFEGMYNHILPNKLHYSIAELLTKAICLPSGDQLGTFMVP